MLRIRAVRVHCTDMYLAELYSHLPLQHAESDMSQLEPNHLILTHCQLATQAAMRGDLDRALQLLTHVRETLPVLPHANAYLWIQCACNILHTYAVSRNDIQLAHVAGTLLWGSKRNDTLALFRSALLNASQANRFEVCKHCMNPWHALCIG
jgi:hypothetical protein